MTPRGFKILLEIAVRHLTLVKCEVPFVFVERTADGSKGTLQEGLRYLRLLADMRWSLRPKRDVRRGPELVAGARVTRATTPPGPSATQHHTRRSGRVVMAVGTSYRVKPGRMLRQTWQTRSPSLRGVSWTGRHGVLLVALLGAFLRFWQIGSLGFNSDEAVYAGQAAEHRRRRADVPAVLPDLPGAPAALPVAAVGDLPASP